MRFRYIVNFVLIQMMFLASLATYEAFAAANYDRYNYNYEEGTRCDIYDPYEALNRKIFIFNSVLDGIILRPIAKGYSKVTNDYTKNRIESFVDNISEPLSTVNYALQGNVEGTFKSFWRFVLNSTFGIAGLFDVAAKAGLRVEEQTLGNTLARYGLGPGPYIVLPIYGGMPARDVSDSLISNNLLNPLKYYLHRDFKYGIMATKIVHSRSKIMPFTDYVSKNSPDPYIAVRNAILNQRESKVNYPDNFRCPTVK